MGARSISDGRTAPRVVPAAACAALLCLATLLLWWPGVALYDTVAQYREALNGAYDDWHPPIMARLWSVLHPIAAGAGPMLAVQVVLYWAGFGLIAAALARAGKLGWGIGVLAIGLCPVFLAWQVAVLKDAQMAGAMLAVIGLVAWWRLAGRAIPRVAVAAIVVLLGYATLVRGNAVFATIPLAVVLSPWPVRWIGKVGAGVALTGVVLAVSPFINDTILRATPTQVSRTQPIYDLVGIAHFAPGAPSPGLTDAERVLVATRHCYTPFFWDPMGDDAHCGEIAERLDDGPKTPLMRAWVQAILSHPVAYALHRVHHLNSTDRFIVPLGWPSAVPPSVSNANDVGLASPGPATARLMAIDAIVTETPLGWPIAWIVIAAACVWIGSRQPRGACRDLALALAVSALALETSFAAVSIASDLRYHLWSMIAAALSAVLLASERRLPRRPALVAGGVLALVVIAGTAARITLPRSPATYAGMLG